MIPTETPDPASGPETPPAPVQDPAPATGKDPAPATAPEPKWWQTAAGETKDFDEKTIKILENYKSVAELARAHQEAQQTIGRLARSQKLPETASAEAQAEWRKANGIPETPDKYDLKLDEGIAIGEADKPIVDSILKEMHAGNVPSNVASKIVNTYYNFLEDQIADQHNADEANRVKAVEALQEAWGAEYKPSLNHVENLLAGVPGEAGGLLKGARLPDGRLLQHSPEIQTWLLGIARDLNPTVTVPPNATNPGMGIDEEIAQIEKAQGSDSYYKDPALRKRYIALLDAKARSNAR